MSEENQEGENLHEDKKDDENSTEELDEESSEEESSLEEKIEETTNEIDSEKFEEFLQQLIIENSSPSLEKINAPQENLWRVEGGFGSEDFNEKKDEIKYSSHAGTDLKYEQMKNHSPERVSFGEIKTPEQILEEQRNIHSQTFIQDSGLLAMKEKQKKEQGYITNPDIRTKEGIENIRKDYMQKS